MTYNSATDFGVLQKSDLSRSYDVPSQHLSQAPKRDSESILAALFGNFVATDGRFARRSGESESMELFVVCREKAWIFSG